MLAPDGEVEGAEERLRRRAGAGRGLGPDGSRGSQGAEARGHADRSAELRSMPLAWGSGTIGISRSRIMSVVTSSARAVKLGTIRWRRTSWASSVTSVGMT